MKKNRISAITIPSFVALALVAGLLITGCGRNQAQAEAEAETSPTPVVEPVAEAETVDTARVRTVELDRREEALTERLLELEERMDDIQRREAELVSEEASRTEPQTVSYDPLYAAPQPRTIFVTLPIETTLGVEFLDELSSETSVVGDPFVARVIQNVTLDGQVAVPVGSEVHGVVAAAVPQKKIGGQAQLSLDFVQITLPDGQRVDLVARLDTAGKKQTKKDAVTISGSAAGGAILGRVLSKNDKTKGTAIGAVLGAAIGTAVASKNAGDPVVIERFSTAELLLEAPLEIAVLVRNRNRPRWLRTESRVPSRVATTTCGRTDFPPTPPTRGRCAAHSGDRAPSAYLFGGHELVCALEWPFPTRQAAE